MSLRVFTPSTSHGPASSSRDGRIDFVRGLCLIDMVLVHLIVWQIDPGRQIALWLGEYLRFAAGGFVVMSGLTIAAVAQARTARGMSHVSVAKWLWHRAAFVLAMHYAATFAFIFLFPLNGTTKVLPPLPDLLTDIVLLRSGSDLLPFYAVMLAFTPLLVWANRSRAGAAGVLAGSAALFAWSGYGEHYKAFPLPLQQTFFLPLWQMMFVIGLVAGRFWKNYLSLDFSFRLTLALASWLAVAGCTVAAYGAWWGLPIPDTKLFLKNPLTAWEAVRYLSWTSALLLTADLAAKTLDASRAAERVRKLGRKSLELYVAHVFIAALIGCAVQKLGWVGPQNLIFSALMIAALYGIALAIDRPRKALLRTAQAGDGFRLAGTRAVAGVGLVGLLLVGGAPIIVGARRPASMIVNEQVTAAELDESSFFLEDEPEALPIGPQDFQPDSRQVDPINDLNLAPTEAA